jgi:hypothetical protein
MPAGLIEAVAALVQPVVASGKATIATRQLGGHYEVEITPVVPSACPVTIVGVVLGDLTLAVGRPPLHVDLWTGDEDEGRTVLGEYLAAIFAGRVRQEAWVKNGRVSKGTMTFDLARRTLTHRYSPDLVRSGSKVVTSFDPY